MAEPDVVVVTTVIDDRAAADRIAGELVAARVAACVQVSGPVSSTYWWQGQVESAQEWTIAAKTPKERAGALVDAIVAAHSYDVPEVLVTDVLGGHTPYLEWVAAETAPR